MVRFGLAFVPTLPPERLIEVVRAADRFLDEFWVWEDCFKESGIASAVAALASTERVTVGLGLMPTPLRNVALTAMEIATIHRLYPGRFVPGVGHGVQSWMAQVGARVTSPLTLLEEYATALRRLLDGEKVSVAGRYITLDEVALDWPPPVGTPLALGGVGPKTLAVAGQHADVLLLAAALSLSDLAEARRLAGDLPTVFPLIVATEDGARERAEREISNWRTDDQVMGRYAAGSAEEIADVVRDAVAAGATSICFQPTEGEPDLLGLIEFLGTEVRAHV